MNLSLRPCSICSIVLEFSSSGMIEQYLGSENDQWNFKPAKTLQDLVSHTHDHIITFAMIFFSVGIIFYFKGYIINYIS